MVQCNRCDDVTEYEWFEDQFGKWKLGIKIDINNYRQHRCVQLPVNGTTTSNKRNWITFKCKGCGRKTKQNLKMVKNLNLCIDCTR